MVISESSGSDFDFLAAAWPWARNGDAESQRSGGLGGGLSEPASEADKVEVRVGQVGLAAQYYRDSAGPQLVRVCLALVAERIETNVALRALFNAT